MNAARENKDLQLVKHGLFPHLERENADEFQSVQPKRPIKLSYKATAENVERQLKKKCKKRVAMQKRSSVHWKIKMLICV